MNASQLHQMRDAVCHSKYIVDPPSAVGGRRSSGRPPELTVLRAATESERQNEQTNERTSETDNGGSA